MRGPAGHVVGALGTQRACAARTSSISMHGAPRGRRSKPSGVARRCESSDGLESLPKARLA